MCWPKEMFHINPLPLPSTVTDKHHHRTFREQCDETLIKFMISWKRTCFYFMDIILLAAIAVSPPSICCNCPVINTDARNRDKKSRNGIRGDNSLLHNVASGLYSPLTPPTSGWTIKAERESIFQQLRAMVSSSRSPSLPGRQIAQRMSFGWGCADFYF